MEVQNNQSGRNTHEIYDSKGHLIAEGNLDYIGEKISVFNVHGIFDRGKTSGIVKIESKISYEEVYSAKVERIESHRIMLESLRNISADLREDLKVDYRGPAKIFYTQMGDSGKSGKKETLIAEARMENISGGGVSFIAEKEFQKGDELAIKTMIPDLFFELQIKILRKENFGRLYKYGCKFINISKIEESSVRKLVYKLQIDNRNHLKAREDQNNEEK